MNDEHTTKRPPQERVESYWLVLHYADNPPIRLDARLLDRGLCLIEISSLKLMKLWSHSESQARTPFMNLQKG